MKPNVQQFWNQTLTAELEEIEVDTTWSIEVFNHFDTDGNGYLNRPETMKLAKVGKSQTDVDAEKQVTDVFLDRDFTRPSFQRLLRFRRKI